VTLWPFRKARNDPRSGRLVFVIECLLNQNARDQGAADSPAVTRSLLELLADADIGMAQIPCPEIACLGFRRRREPGQSIRQALETPVASRCCRRLAEATAERMACYQAQGFDIVAVLGGNEQSPACAVHPTSADGTRLGDRSGVFMLALAAETAGRGRRVPFRGIRDNDRSRLREDLDWLRWRIG
jgi:predicted secreted protein